MNVDQTRQNELDTYLTEHTEVHGIFSLSQLQTRGYVQLASGSAWGSRVHIVGIDYQESIRPAIEDGVLSLLDKNSQGLGITAVQTALKLAAGEPIEDRRVYVETLVLDSSSLSNYLDGMR
jgi:ABC-type sugar transport system substrate-binding protein